MKENLCASILLTLTMFWLWAFVIWLTLSLKPKHTKAQKQFFYILKKRRWQ